MKSGVAFRFAQALKGGVKSMLFRWNHLFTFIFSTIFLLCGFFSVAIADSERATVLVLFQPHKISGRSWDLGKGADPMVCLDHGCYTGRGFVAPAKYYKGKKALLPAVQARACRNSLSCVYRKVYIPTKEIGIWPIDHDVINSDHLEKARAKIDKSCDVEDGQLQCSKGIFTDEYSMWIVPESVADRAGKKALDYALYKGLYKARQRYKKRFIQKQRQYLPLMVESFYNSILDTEISPKCASDPDLIAETLYVTGILDSEARRATAYIRKFIKSNSDASSGREASFSSSHFWNFHSALRTLDFYTKADSYNQVAHQKGLKIGKFGKRVTLYVGGDVKSRAEHIVSECNLSRRIAKNEG